MNGMNGARSRTQTEQRVWSSLLPSQSFRSRRRYHLRSVSIPKYASCRACRVWKLSSASVVRAMWRLEPACEPAVDVVRLATGVLDLHHGVVEPLDLLLRREHELVSPVKVLPGLGTAHQEHPDGVGPELLHGILEQEDVALGRGHLGPVQEAHAEDDHALREEFFWPSKTVHVVEDLEGEVVRDQVLCREPEVVRVPGTGTPPAWRRVSSSRAGLRISSRGRCSRRPRA